MYLVIKMKSLGLVEGVIKGMALEFECLKRNLTDWYNLKVGIQHQV